MAVGVTTVAYGLSFGALSVASGVTLWQTAFLSLVMFSGGSQFALIGVLAAGGVAAGSSAIAGAALLGTRNGLYGIRTAPIVGLLWPRLKRRQALVVATALTPVLAPGLPVLAAALVVVVGWSNWAGARPGAPSGTPMRGSGR
ncbi:AzlC family ABC transporter permease [Cryobacterium sp. GrIS_2_6]|uniref:AzlC family ABC transporter permease n=1 Tax=Cryobacterium sp. GrIS_2_6 TaxID=3162785 RepID=UPI002E0DA162